MLISLVQVVISCTMQVYDRVIQSKRLFNFGRIDRRVLLAMLFDFILKHARLAFNRGKWSIWTVNRVKFIRGC